MRGFAIPGALLLFLACAKVRERPAPQGRQMLEEFTMSQSRRGKPAWRLSSRLAILNEDVGRIMLVEPRMEFYQEGRPASRVESLKGEADLETRDVQLSSSVVVTSLDEKSVLRTERLTYSNQRRKFFTDRPVVVKRPGAVLRGQGFEADSDLSRIRIFRQESLISR